MANKSKKYKSKYPKGGDGMFFYHKSTRHPAKQLAHTEKTWTNRRYTHSPNNLKNYRLDKELSTSKEKIYYHKSNFTDSIYTRGKPYYGTLYKKKKR